jgi:hypothetical protein
MEIAKVVDFGLLELIYGEDDITHVTTNVKGILIQNAYLDTYIIWSNVLYCVK